MFESLKARIEKFILPVWHHVQYQKVIAKAFSFVEIISFKNFDLKFWQLKNESSKNEFKKSLKTNPDCLKYFHIVAPVVVGLLDIKLT